jgi:hypothetical protein
LLKKHNLCLRDLYRTTEKSGAHPMKDAQVKLDDAVRAAYGIQKEGEAKCE